MNNVDLGQVFTRRFLADYMVSLFTLSSKSVVLDPCFGRGVFLDSISTNTDYSLCGYEIDNELFNLYHKKAVGISLYNNDFLLDNTEAKYDGVIMNPPYIRHEKIDSMKSYGITKSKLFRNSIFSKLPKTANLYMYFVVKAIDVLKANGELIVIFPESWLNSKSGATFRNILSTYCSVEKRIHVNGRAFEKDALVDVIILKLKKNASLLDCEPLYVNIDGDNISKREVEQFKKTSHNRVPFTSYATIRRGLTTGCNDIFVNPQVVTDGFNLIDIISSPKSVVGFSTKKAVTDKLLIVENGLDINDKLRIYFCDWEKRILETEKPKTLATKIKNGEKWYLLKNLNCRGIIFGYMVRNNMRFILNDSSITVRDNFYVITPKIDYYIMLALLNNYYVYAQLEANGRKYGGGMLKLQKYDVESLTLADLSVMSEKDKNTLSGFGRKLSETGDIKIIDNITTLLSTFETLDLTEIKSQCEYMRTKRLENTK